jgi:hypothetical protein
MGLHKDSNRIENMFVHVFYFSIPSRHRRGFRGSFGIQRIYLEYRFDPVICGPRCLSSSYIAHLPVITIVVAFIFNDIEWVLVLTIDFNPNISKWNN